MPPPALASFLLSLGGPWSPATVPNEEPHYRFGCSVAGLGDVDGDGTPDFLIADPDEPGPGRVWLVSGKTSKTIYMRTGQAAGDDFGWDLRAVGDVDGDGIADWITGADGMWRFNRDGEWYASVHSGRNGKLLFLIRSSDCEAELGRSFAGAGDVDGDGKEDLAIGAKRIAGSKDLDGVAYVYSGSEAKRIRTLGRDVEIGTEAHDIACLGDCDGDKVPDFLVALHRPTERNRRVGTVTLFSGAGGRPLWTVRLEWDESVQRVRAAGDIDGDGIQDALVSWCGTVVLLSGRDGTMIRRYHPDTYYDPFSAPREITPELNGFGCSLTILRKPGNGLTLAVGAENAGASVGGVYCLDPETGEKGTIINKKLDGSLYHLGSNLDRAGDVDGDGWDDLLCGTFSYFGKDDGRAVLYSGKDGRELRRYARRGDEVVLVNR